MAQVLVIHSQTAATTALASRLTQEGHQVTQASDVSAATEALQNGVELVLLEHAPLDGSASRLIDELRALGNTAPIIALAVPVDQVAPVLRAGAYFYTHAPLNVDEVSLVCERALSGHPKSTGHTLRPGVAHAELDDLLGNSPQIAAVKQAIVAVAASPGTNVLLTGESGSGKDLVARIIHSATNPNGPFFGLTCSALPEGLLEAELFGTAADPSSHDGPGNAGLLEQADGGTVFLDEIEALPAATQAKLLAFAEDKTFRRLGATSDMTSSARVIAATRQDVQKSFGEGKLREDLLHRLAVATIHMPPLRERKEDIPLLAKHYLNKFSSRAGKRVSKISGGALTLLQEHYWPGNVRELCNTLERATLLATGDTLESTHISFSPGSKPPPGRFRLPPQGIDFRELEREVVAQALELAKGNQTRAASLLRMTRDQIRYRMAKFGITDASAPAELALD